jgi:subtilase family serine protease
MSKKQTVCALALTILAVTLLFSTTTLAAQQHQQAIVAEKAQLVEAAAPNATAQFTCELKKFDLSQGLTCYGPAAIRSAYGVSQLIADGSDGSGQTIVIIDAYGSPTAAADLHTFSARFGLPDADLTIIHMPGSTPFDFGSNNQLGWAEETSLDLQWSHAIAPGAKLVLVAAATNNDDDIIAAQNYAIDNRLGNVISESFGESESALLQFGAAGRALIDQYEDSYQRARIAGITVLVSSGDSGTAEGDLNGNLIPTPAASYPASSPQVTTVGGTNLFFGSTTNANPNGTYQGEVVWNDGFGAGGGGLSAYFKTPAFQQTLSKASIAALKNRRGYPDVAYNGGVVGGVIVRLGFFGGYFIFGGTSAGAPQWAGVVSIANQLAAKPRGFLNPRLYKMGTRGFLGGGLMHDVLLGNNGFDGITGYPAAGGWDLSTGWGTPSTGLVKSLADTDEGNE